MFETPKRRELELSKASAFRLANIITKYWRKRGYVVFVDVVLVEANGALKSKIGGRGNHYVLRSDMVDGLPLSLWRGLQGVKASPLSR